MQTSSEDFTVESSMYHATFCITYKDSVPPETNSGTALSFIYMISVMPMCVPCHYFRLAPGRPVGPEVCRLLQPDK